MRNNTKRYNDEQLAKFKNIIEAKLKEAKEELTSIQQDQKQQKQHLADTNVDFNENSKHFQQQAKNQQFIRRLQRKSRELKSALKRVEDKTYGICERSGELIREKRLLAMPTATFDIKPR